MSCGGICGLEVGTYLLFENLINKGAFYKTFSKNFTSGVGQYLLVLQIRRSTHFVIYTEKIYTGLNIDQGIHKVKI